MSDDVELLRQYARTGSESAFEELVQRNLPLVYSAALRQVGGDQALAQDVAQTVFIDLARKASALVGREILAGWLYASTRLAALNAVRTEGRRRFREGMAVAMQEPVTSSLPGQEPADLKCVVDDAMSQLEPGERNAVLLRFFQGKGLRDVGAALGISEDAARMRVNRSLAKLHTLLSHRGVVLPATALAGVLAAETISAVPPGLAASVVGAALAKTTVSTAAATMTAKAIAMTTLHKILTGATIAMLAGFGLYQARQNSRLRQQIRTLAQQQAPLIEQAQQLGRERDDTSNRLALLAAQNARLNRNDSELLRLRNRATMAQTDQRELARAEAALRRQAATIGVFTNAMAAGLSTAEKWNQKEALARLARMKKLLHLSDDQERSIGEIMMQHIRQQSQAVSSLMLGKPGAQAGQSQAAETGNEEAEIQALLTPEQAAAYGDYQLAQQKADAESLAGSDASHIADTFSLSSQQKDQLHSLFYDLYLKRPSSGVEQAAGTQPTAADRLAAAVRAHAQQQRAELEQKSQILQGFLSPEQIATYRQEEEARINRQEEAVNMLFSSKGVTGSN